MKTNNNEKTNTQNIKNQLWKLKQKRNNTAQRKTTHSNKSKHKTNKR